MLRTFTSPFYHSRAFLMVCCEVTMVESPNGAQILFKEVALSQEIHIMGIESAFCREVFLFCPYLGGFHCYV